MKVIGCFLTIVLIPCLAYADPVPVDQDFSEHFIYIENLSVQELPNIVYRFLESEPLYAGREAQWHYCVVYSDDAKQGILTQFLSRLQHFHRHSKLPFETVADYWTKMFDVPIQIYVFHNTAEKSHEFCTSQACEKIIQASRMLDLGFIWNGTLCIAEDDIKTLLHVPEEYSLVTTIFLPSTDRHEVSRAHN